MKKPIYYDVWYNGWPIPKPATCPLGCEGRSLSGGNWEEVWESPNTWRWDWQYRWPRPKKAKTLMPKEVHEDPEVRVTKINKRWHSRLIYKGKVVDELACELTEDIGLICKEMLRWFDKMGNISKYADRSRHRRKAITCCFRGKTWSRPELEAEKAKREKEKHGKV